MILRGKKRCQQFIGKNASITNRRHQVGDEIEMPEIFGVVPRKHHVYVFTKSKSFEEALFYINKVATEGWSRAYLEHQVDAHLFQTQGSAITNFDLVLPASQSESAKEPEYRHLQCFFIKLWHCCVCIVKLNISFAYLKYSYRNIGNEFSMEQHS